MLHDVHKHHYNEPLCPTYMPQGTAKTRLYADKQSYNRTTSSNLSQSH